MRKPPDGADTVQPIVEIPPIVSVDDHVVEPPDLWNRWLPSRFRNAAPKVVRAPYAITAQSQVIRAESGPETDFWTYDGHDTSISKGFAAAGLSNDQIDLHPVNFGAMRPGFYDPKARLIDMDMNHVERSLCFPTFPRFCGQTFLEGSDKELGLACIRAYNDWMVDEWCGDSGGRLIPLCLIPLWDASLAAAEVRRNAARGVRAVAFSEMPYHLGLPSLHDAEQRWDPFLASCNDTGTVICIHIGSSSTFTTSSPDASRSARVCGTSINSMLS
jgi:predicted TIM-barrel fold metal-dependent hydrolase